MQKIYPLQTKLAKRVMDKLSTSDYVALCAPPSSGKTGTMIEIARLFKGQTYFLTAVSDLDVRAQTNAAFNGTNIKIIDKFVTNTLINKETLKALGKTINKGSLVVLDEAHFGIGTTNLISPVFTYLVDTLKCKLVAISATNFVFQQSMLGNLAALVSPTPLELTTVRYIGMKELLPNIIDLDNNTSPKDNLRALVKAMDDFLKHGKGKYFIMRDSGSSVYEKHKNDGLFNGIDVIKWDTNNPDTFTCEQLSVKPNKPTLILIKGFLRLGKVLDKTNIFAVWETSKGDITTIAQALFGRCCGYDRAALNIKIYGKKSAILFYIKLMENNFELTHNTMETLPVDTKLDRRVVVKRTVDKGIAVQISEKEALRLMKDKNSKTSVHRLVDHNTPDLRQTIRNVRNGVYWGGGIYRPQGHIQGLVVIENPDGTDENLPKGIKEYWINLPDDNGAKHFDVKTKNAMYNIVKVANEKGNHVN